MCDKIQQCLESLLTESNSTGRIIISGFNHHARLVEYHAPTILTFSNVHSRQEYLSTMMEDLYDMGYPDKNVAMTLRDKKGYFRWKTEFILRENGVLQENLHVLDIETGEEINLEKIPFDTLEKAGYPEEYSKKLVAYDKGYEMIIYLSAEEDIYKIASKFLSKASKELYSAECSIISETTDQLKARAPWPGAYDVPMLIIAGDLQKIKQELFGFKPATLFRFCDSSIGEYSFVIGDRLNHLKSLEEYAQFSRLGFVELPCLANARFIKDYVDIFK